MLEADLDGWVAVLMFCLLGAAVLAGCCTAFVSGALYPQGNNPKEAWAEAKATHRYLDQVYGRGQTKQMMIDDLIARAENANQVVDS